jgi:hypothetical protein
VIESASEFVRLRTSALPEEYRRAAHEEAPIEVWRELIRDHPDMRSWVAHNKTVPMEIFEALAADESTHVRGVVAGKRKATLALLTRLAHDPDSGVRFAVACNQSTTAEILRLLVNDQHEFIATRAKARLDEAR